MEAAIVWKLPGEAVPLETRWPRVWEAEREVPSSSQARAGLLYTLGSEDQGCTRVSLQPHRNTALADQGSDAYCLGNHAARARKASGHRRWPVGVEAGALHSAPEQV